jgi:hypothetical protein
MLDMYNTVRWFDVDWSFRSNMLSPSSEPSWDGKADSRLGVLGYSRNILLTFGRGAMSETQSEQYTTPEFAATLSLPGGRTSLGTSPLAEHAAALNDAGRRTLQVCCHVEPNSRSHTRILLLSAYSHISFSVLQHVSSAVLCLRRLLASPQSCSPGSVPLHLLWDLWWTKWDLSSLTTDSIV